MKHYINRNSKVFRFLLTLTIVGLLTGVIIYLNLNQETKKIIIESLTNINQNLKESRQNNIIYHLFIISSFILLSLTLLLYPLTIFYIFYETLSLGFILTYYGSVFNIGGIIYSLIYFLINKALFLLILTYITFISYKLIKKIIYSIIKKDNLSVRDLYSNYFKRIGICILFILITDIFVYFFGNKILSIFQFLI